MNPVCPSCSPISASALQGMQRAEAQFGKAADKIAQLPNALNMGAAGAAGDTVDLSAQMVALLGARDNFMANVEAFKTGDSMQRALLNMVG
jgi:flagellar hook protein FlgE